MKHLEAAPKRPSPARLLCVLVLMTPLLAALSPARPAHAQGFPVFDPANHIELILQLENMRKRYDELKEHTERFRQNLKQLSGGGWIGVPSQELTLRPSLKMGGLSYRSSGIAGNLQTVMPGYQTWTDYATELETSIEETMETLRASMEVMNEHDATITDHQRLDDLRAAAQSTSGNLQALQNGNEIRTYVAAQVQSLRQMIATLANIEAVYMSQQTDERARRAAVGLKTSQDLLDCFHGSGTCQ